MFSTLKLACFNAFGMATVGAIGKSIGSQAPSAKAITLAKGVNAFFLTYSPVASVSTAAPSLSVEAFAAVTVPFSF